MTASPTFLRGVCGVTTVSTTELMDIFIVRQRDVAIFAERNMAAFLTLEH
jgi:hypothetical protein